jgi:Ser/Thr protein kinase RdoA (MazF antagonist)
MHASQLETVRAFAGGGGNASVSLVEAEGRRWVLKRHRPRDVAAERLFHQTLRSNGLPALLVAECDGLGPDELLLEYVDGSPTLGRVLGATTSASRRQELYRRWGSAMRALHGVRFRDQVILDAAGRPQISSWRDFSAKLVARTIERLRRLATDLPAELLDQAERHLDQLSLFAPAGFVLTHGDLHANNALMRADEVVLFDKPADVWSAPAMFDVCLVLSEAFPGARYGAAREGDHERLAAFMDGYGDLPADEADWIEHFVLLRSLRRYPNPFVPEMRSIIELALARISAAA